MRSSENPATALMSDCCSHTGEITCWKTKQRKKDLYRDPLGYYWCDLHKYRGHLLLWGSRHGYPHIAFHGSLIWLEVGGCMHYAIGDDSCRREDRQTLWEMAILLGNDDMILSAFRYVYSVLEEI